MGMVKSMPFLLQSNGLYQTRVRLSFGFGSMIVARLQIPAGETLSIGGLELRP
jgi:hypothetical protein